MALASQQIVVSSVTATALLVQGSGAGQFVNTTGTASDPLPVIIRNLDAAITVWIGGPGVSTSNGMELLPGESMPMQLIGNGLDIPYGLAASGSPKVAVLVGRQ